MKKQSIVVLDILGISSAGLCLIHCLVFPILSIIPFGFSDTHWIDIFFACIGMFVVSKIVMSKTSKKVKLILASSIIIIIIGVVLEIIWKINTQMILIGGIGMIFGHLLNYKSHSKSRFNGAN
ncbi:MerC domain-containing protein [Flavobacterium marginilacus]|uniref:MerC domain-containing protein n=1 Tax=Flavobacterium marginilacus TaxID=3003256 RepID=UPI00248DDCD7|nr:MerC domain-containing protein [Flavobacterium marginilacus]